MEIINNPKDEFNFIEISEIAEKMEQMRDRLNREGTNLYCSGRHLTDATLIDMSNEIQNIYGQLMDLLKGQKLNEFEKRRLTLLLSKSNSMELNEQHDAEIRSIFDIADDMERDLLK